MTYNTKNWKRKNSKDIDYINSSRRFRPLGSSVMALSIKCNFLALRTESREEWILSSGINCMSVWEWLEWERKCLETVVGLDLMLVLSTARLCSLNLSLRRRLVYVKLSDVSRTDLTIIRWSRSRPENILRLIEWTKPEDQQKEWTFDPYAACKRTQQLPT